MHVCMQIDMDERATFRVYLAPSFVLISEIKLNYLN